MIAGPSKAAPTGPLPIAMHRPELAQAMSDLGVASRFNSSFAPRPREFTILLTGRYWDCQFEWASHEAEARKAGLSPASIETPRAGGTRFDAAEFEIPAGMIAPLPPAGITTTVPPRA